VRASLTTLAGTAGVRGSTDAAGAEASFDQPFGVAQTGGDDLCGRYGNNSIRKITRAGVVTTLAGLGSVFGSADGTGAAASFRSR